MMPLRQFFVLIQFTGLNTTASRLRIVAAVSSAKFRAVAAMGNHPVGDVLLLGTPKPRQVQAPGHCIYSPPQRHMAIAYSW